MDDKRKKLIKRILNISEEIYNRIGPAVPEEWLSSDLTVAQLRVLLALHTGGPHRMSAIASALNVALPTATGIVDNMVSKDLLVRDEDPHDRRVVICKLSPRGQELINKLWNFGRFQMEKLLESLTFEQLQKATDVAEILRNNMSKCA